MQVVKRGNGIRFLDEKLEIASFRTLIAIYSHLVSIEDMDNLIDALFVFQEYIYKEYKKLYKNLKVICTSDHYHRCDCMDYRLNHLKKSIEEKLFMTPSEILLEFDRIKNFKKLIQIQEVSCFPCIKLK